MLTLPDGIIPEEEIRKVGRYLRGRRFPETTAEIACALGMPESKCGRRLQILRRRRLITMHRRGWLPTWLALP